MKNEWRLSALHFTNVNVPTSNGRVGNVRTAEPHCIPQHGNGYRIPARPVDHEIWRRQFTFFRHILNLENDDPVK